jgi:prevent-host-death family protein
MAAIGVRELRQRASEFLRRVEAGETFEVTDRGRPVAMLCPVPARSPLDRLRASGEVIEAEGTLADLPPPLAIGPGTRRPSAILARLRADER